MVVAVEHGACKFFANLVAIGAGVSDEEALVAGEAVDHGRFLPAERHAVGGIGDFEAGEVADILAQRAKAVHARAEPGAVAVILFDQPVGFRAEALVSRLRPPVAGASGGVRLAALVVKAVAHLVADDGADAAVIFRRVGVGIEIGGLQDASGQDETVGEGVVEGIDDMGGRHPALAVDRTAQVRLLLLPVEFVAGVHGLDQLAGFDIVT